MYNLEPYVPAFTILTFQTWQFADSLDKFKKTE